MPESVLLAAQRAWVERDHFRNIMQGEWLPLPNVDGIPLPGIRGRAGACAISSYGEEIGVDLVEMQPGSAFPLHAHPGDHMLYVESGRGFIHIAGKDRPVKKGDTIFVPAEAPHAVQGPDPRDTEPLVFVFFSQPHKHLEAIDRMHTPRMY
jgi:quercetin dioxygenase-like cupin family protein